MDIIPEWNFIGSVSPSKSLFNRGLILSSFDTNLRLLGDSDSEDVTLLKAALEQFSENKENPVLNCGSGGTTLRFLALRVSREPGEYTIKGSARLFSRPQQPLVKLLAQLGVDAELSENSIHIRSNGWKLSGDGVHADGSQSSQFISALLLSSVDHPHPIYVSVGRRQVSKPYLEMTIRLLESMKIVVQSTEDGLYVPPDQKLKPKTLRIEPDFSSAFTLACLGALSGQLILKDFPNESLQPDRAFVDILAGMGVPCQFRTGQLRVSQAPELSAVEVNIEGTPDLFPSLAVLCCFAGGVSKISGIANNRIKESDRVANISDLLKKLGINVQVEEDCMVIHGDPSRRFLKSEFEMDSDSDHRIAMAAGILMRLGCNIYLKNPNVVSKSFPRYWETIGVKPWVQ